jgi:hypothetical protein
MEQDCSATLSSRLRTWRIATRAKRYSRGKRGHRCQQANAAATRERPSTLAMAVVVVVIVVIVFFI